MVVEIATVFRLEGLGFEHRCGRGFPDTSEPVPKPTQPPVK